MSKELVFGDGLEIIAPEVVDLSKLGVLDDLEYEVWNLIKQYMGWFGIRLKDESDEEPDWATVKEVQEVILKSFEEAGVKFNFGNENK